MKTVIFFICNNSIPLFSQNILSLRERADLIENPKERIQNLSNLAESKLRSWG